jgi:uncharacterized protein YfaT (DUF1175 family)
MMTTLKPTQAMTLNQWFVAAQLAPEPWLYIIAISGLARYYPSHTFKAHQLKVVRNNIKNYTHYYLDII